MKYSEVADFHQQNFPNTFDVSNVSGPANIFILFIRSIYPVNIITKCAQKCIRKSQHHRWKLVRCQKDCVVFLRNENENGICNVKTTNSSSSRSKKKTLGIKSTKKHKRRTQTNRATKQKQFHLVTTESLQRVLWLSFSLYTGWMYEALLCLTSWLAVRLTNTA